MARRQDGTPGSDPTGSSYWVFVDLAKESPEFYMVESDEVESGIAADVELWLAERPGRVPTGSHPIPMSSVAHGHDRWDLLNLNRVRDSRHRKEVSRPRTQPAKAIKPAAEPEFVDPRTAIVSDFGGYRIQARFDPENSNVEITRGPMEGRRFSIPPPRRTPSRSSSATTTPNMTAGPSGASTISRVNPSERACRTADKGSSVFFLHSPFDGGAGVHYHCDPGAGRPREGVLVDHTELKPHAFRADVDGLIGELAGCVGPAEHIDDVDGERYIGEGRVALLTEDGRSVRVDGHNPFPPLAE